MLYRVRRYEIDAEEMGGKEKEYIAAEVYLESKLDEILHKKILNEIKAGWQKT